MAGTLLSVEGSPSSLKSPLGATQDWELLSMSASTLLAHGHGIGFGLPPPSTPGLHASRTAEDGACRIDGDSDAGKEIFSRTLPLDVSQIAVICTSSTSVEPFTEGWKPQFRIAGAPLQENYYALDPFETAASNTVRSIEPFLDMEQSFLKDPLMAADGEALANKRKGLHPPENTGNCVNSLQQQETDEDRRVSHEKVMKVAISKSDTADSNKASARKSLTTQGKCLRQKRQGFFHRKSHVAWSVALTTALLGVVLITYCSQTEHNELLTGDEVS